MRFQVSKCCWRYVARLGLPHYPVPVIILIFLKSNFYVFAPKQGNLLDVAVLTVGKTSATAEGKKTGQYCITAMFKSLNVSALGTFKVQIRNLPPDHSLTVGQAETIRIVSVAYDEGLPEIIGVRVRDIDREDLNQV